jgi:hypothetical protein
MYRPGRSVVIRPGVVAQPATARANETMPARKYNRGRLIRGSCATKDLLFRRGGIVSIRGNQQRLAGRSMRTAATLFPRDYNVDTPFSNGQLPPLRRQYSCRTESPP